MTSLATSFSHEFVVSSNMFVHVAKILSITVKKNNISYQSSTIS